MAILEAVLTQEFAGQETINRWNYVSSGTPAAVSLSFALASAMGAIFDNSIIPAQYPDDKLMCMIAKIQALGVTFNSLSVRVLYSMTDFYETPFSPALHGVWGLDAAAPFVAFGFRTNRIRLDVRRGTKRFVGGADATVGADGEVNVAPDSPLDDLRIAMNEALSYDDEGNTLTFVPAVCGKLKYEVMKDGEPTGRFAYKYYPDETTQLAHTAQGVQWQPYDHVRSQTSRQYGKGR